VKRNWRGYAFLTGDELPYPMVSKHVVEAILGDRLDDDLKVEEVVAEVQKTFHPFFIIPDEERRARCEKRWRQLLGDYVLCLETPDDVCFVTAGAVLLGEGLVKGRAALQDALASADVPKERLKSVVRALTPLAEVLEKHGQPQVGAAATAPAKGLKRLFGK
jgi:hypothetical protein